MRRFPSLVALVLIAICALSSGVAQAELGPVRMIAPHFHEELVLFGVDAQARLNRRELDLLGQLMRCRRTRRRHAIASDLGRHLVRLGRRFHRPVYLVSGYRAVAINGHRRSYHLRGMAADVYVPGVSAQEVRDFAVAQRVPGIGYYPESGFVHLDVRPEQFWWVDYSSPERSERLRPDPEGTAAPRPE